MKKLLFLSCLLMSVYTTCNDAEDIKLVESLGHRLATEQEKADLVAELVICSIVASVIRVSQDFDIFEKLTKNGLRALYNNGSLSIIDLGKILDKLRE